MSGLLVPSTQVQVLRGSTAAEVDAEFRDDTGTAAVAVGQPIPAHIASPTGSRSFSPSGSDVVSQFKLLTGPADIRAGDFVRDVNTSEVYAVDWAVNRQGLLPHLVAGITTTDRLS